MRNTTGYEREISVGKRDEAGWFVFPPIYTQCFLPALPLIRAAPDAALPRLIYHSLIFHGITTELSAEDDHFLKDVFHLVLELKLNERSVDKTDLLSRESSPGVWDANEPLILPEIIAHFTLSVFAELGGEERQLLASQKLYGTDLCDRLGEPVAILLDGHENYPNMVLKAKVGTTVDIFRRALGAEESNNPTEGSGVPNMTPNSSDQIGRFEGRRNLEGLLQLLSQISQNNGGRSPSYGSNSFGNCEDMNKRISQEEEAVRWTPDSHPDKPSRLNTLGNSLLVRFKRLGNLDDIEGAISRHQEAANLTPDGHPNKPSWLNNLGNSLLTRFERLGNLDDIEGAIARHQEVANLTPDGHPNKPSRLNNLGISLHTRFKCLGNLDDIDSAIARHQEAVNLTPDGHPDKPSMLSNLGNSLRIRFERLGNLDDIDSAVARHQEAANFTPDGHPDKPSWLNNLGNSLLTRFEHLGNLDDIDGAIVQHQAAVNLTPEGHLDKPSMLNNLGNSHRIRFERLGNLDDIDGAIARHQEAVKFTPDGHPDKPNWLNNLGNSLQTRFQRLGNLDDIDGAITRHQAAVNLTPDGHPDKPSRLNNLGTSLHTRFKCLGNLDDIDSGVARHQEAVNLIPDGHPGKPSWLNNLGTSLLTRFQRFSHPYDAEASIVQFSVASLSSVGPPSVRLIAARNWIYAASLINHASLLAACESAISIIPLVVWLGLSITDRHQHLAQIGDIVRKVAAIAISLDQCNKALEWLEQGRSIVWTQILQLRTPVDELRAVQPDLADRLLHVSSLLYQGNQDINLQKDHRRSPEEEARQYRALARERDEIVEKIRSLHRFRDFLMPPKLHRLIEGAKEGPVVVINVSEKRCDALALVYGVDEVIHIPLPDLTSERITQLQVEFNALLKSSGVRLRAVRDEEVEAGGDEGCKRILAELWDHFVKPVLDSLAFTHDPDTLPRIWWCVTGQLAFLPIHAAGVYNTGDFSEQIQDYAISSYAPTISALLEQADVPAQKPFRLLSAVEPSSGPSYIPNTEKELDYIRRRLQNRDHVVLHKADATRERVMNAMRDCNWLHLACHGTQIPKNPTKSALLLHGGKLTLEEIIRLNLPHAEFAFLSACQTMTGDAELSDEAVHIAGGMSLAGYRSVVATMWSIEDALAPKVADEFYAHLLKDGERPDCRKAAEALHFSVKKLREEEKDLKMLSWLPFVHLGI
ncbi:hypothetical protein FRC19_004231 [Serendipita sp. 401]|nr:hypothetical protein FRC19_004231 [Serendipita sp. 401]